MPHTRIRWDGRWINHFDIGPHKDAYQGGRHAARIIECRRLAGYDVLPHPSGRRRRLYLALARVGGTWGTLGVYKSQRTAKREVERALRGLTSSKDLDEVERNTPAPGRRPT
jgi:hypothetical protein